LRASDRSHPLANFAAEVIPGSHGYVAISVNGGDKPDVMMISGTPNHDSARPWRGYGRAVVQPLPKLPATIRARFGIGRKSGVARQDAKQQERRNSGAAHYRLRSDASLLIEARSSDRRQRAKWGLTRIGFGYRPDATPRHKVLTEMPPSSAQAACLSINTIVTENTPY
jgi:hypothetical protein